MTKTVESTKPHGFHDTSTVVKGDTRMDTDLPPVTTDPVLQGVLAAKAAELDGRRLAAYARELGLTPPDDRGETDPPAVLHWSGRSGDGQLGRVVWDLRASRRDPNRQPTKRPGTPPPD